MGWSLGHDPLAAAEVEGDDNPSPLRQLTDIAALLKYPQVLFQTLPTTVMRQALIAPFQHGEVRFPRMVVRLVWPSLRTDSLRVWYESPRT